MKRSIKKFFNNHCQGIGVTADIFVFLVIHQKMRTKSATKLLILSVGLLVAVLSFLTTRAQSIQTIRGRIQYEISQIPLPGVTVMMITDKRMILSKTTDKMVITASKTSDSTPYAE